ncbi:MAG: response regulator [Geobacteraceae bacterium]|nr:response regulator [Geobacteraceae bacterium]
MPGNILIVDDVIMFLEIQKGFLKMSSLNILCARDGSEALGIARENKPDLIITDLHMPGMNGSDLCMAIKRDRELAEIPVVMTTSAGKTEDHEACRKSGCDALLTKPFERSSYLNTVRRFIPELDRRETRYPFEATVRFQAFRVNMTGTILNLSRNGLYIATDYALETGTEITLVFSLDKEGNSLVQAKGLVRWRNDGEGRGKNGFPTGFGIEFIAFAGESRGNLNRYLAKFNY